MTQFKFKPHLIDLELPKGLYAQTVLADLDNDIAGLAAAAAEHRAEVLVLGRAEARRGGSSAIGGHTVYRWDITLSIRAVQADSAALLMSK